MRRLMQALAAGVVMTVAAQGSVARASDDRVVIGLAACGLTLTESSVRYVVEQDFTCPTFGYRISGDDVILDLNGHTLTGQGSGIGVEFQVGAGAPASVIDGRIIDFTDGVYVGDSVDMGDFTIDGVEGLANSGSGFEVYAAPAIVKDSVASWNASTGIALSGIGSRIFGSKATSNYGDGIRIAGQQVKVTGTTASSNYFVGMILVGDGTLVKGSRASANGSVGIFLDGDGNVLDSVASDNAVGGIKILPSGANIVNRVDGSKAISNGWAQTTGTYGINVVGPAKGKNVARRNNGVQCDPAKLC